MMAFEDGCGGGDGGEDDDENNGDDNLEMTGSIALRTSAGPACLIWLVMESRPPEYGSRHRATG